MFEEKTQSYYLQCSQVNVIYFEFVQSMEFSTLNWKALTYGSIATEWGRRKFFSILSSSDKLNSHFSLVRYYRMPFLRTKRE